MNFISLSLSLYGNYTLQESSDEKMTILGHFLSVDVSCHSESFKNFALNDEETCTNSNVTYLEKGNNFILLKDLYSNEKVPTRLKMSRQQFVHLLDDWHEKVCKPKPKEVIIKNKNGQFIIETKD